MTIILIKVIGALLGRQVWRGSSVQLIKQMSWSLADTFHPGMNGFLTGCSYLMVSNGAHLFQAGLVLLTGLSSSG